MFLYLERTLLRFCLFRTVHPPNTFYFNPLSLIPPRDLLWNARYFPLPAFVLIWPHPRTSLRLIYFVLFSLHLDPPFRFAHSSRKFFTPAVFNLREREKLSKSENSLFPFLTSLFFKLLSRPRRENSRFAPANSARGLSSAFSGFSLFFFPAAPVFTMPVVGVNFARYSDIYGGATEMSEIPR